MKIHVKTFLKLDYRLEFIAAKTFSYWHGVRILLGSGRRLYNLEAERL